MDYFLLSPNAVNEDNETAYIRIPGQPTKSVNIGIEFDHWPFDDLFETSMDLFCSERLKAQLKISKLTGINRFQLVERVVPNANWNANYAESTPGKYWQVFIEGQPMIDDFAYYKAQIRHLIVSEKGIRFLLNNHCTYIMGQKIIGNEKIVIEKYEQLLKESNYNYMLPKILDIDSMIL
jgi:hypothetical protein